MPDPNTRSACVLLRQPELPLAQSLVHSHASRFPLAPALIPSAVDSQTSRTFETESASLRIELSPAPVPWAELASPCETAWHWPQATRRIKAHSARLIVTVSSSTLDIIDLTLALTYITASAALVTPSLGIYWPAAAQVHDVKSFVDEASHATRAHLPLYLWLRFGWARESDGSNTLYTAGLSAFDLMEVEIPHSALEPQTLVDRAFNIAHYLMERGPVLEDGHTLGISTDEKFEIRHIPSKRGTGQRVYSLRSQSQ